MNPVQQKKMLVGLDIGTSKIVCIVGELGVVGTIEMFVLGTHPSCCMKKVVLVNFGSIVLSIRRAVEDAVLMVGCTLHSVFAGSAGGNIQSMNSHGIVAVRDREVTPADIERVI